MENLQNQIGNLNHAKYKILLVEDQPVIRLIHINFLQSLDCFVHFAENGVQALDSLKENLIKKLSDFDLVFMDMGLPDISGIEVVKTYRKIEKEDTHLFIIALTAYGGKDDRQKFIEAGVDEVVVKPVTIQQLNQILIKYSEMFV